MVVPRRRRTNPKKEARFDKNMRGKGGGHSKCGWIFDDVLLMACVKKE